MEKQLVFITIILAALLFCTVIVVNMCIVRNSVTLETPLQGVRGPYMYRCPSYTGGKIMEEMYSEMGFETTNDPKSAAIWVPCGYTLVEQQLGVYDAPGGQVLLGIDGCDKIVAKNGLWATMIKEYGINGASKYVPKGYLTMLPIEQQRLRAEYRPDQIYIMKKNVQRQLGLKLSNNLEELEKSHKDGYVIVQEYMMNPYLMNGRKFDIRVYLLVLQKNDAQSWYRHAGGRCHYSSVDYRTDSLERDMHIPSGYTEDKKFKEEHPETLQDLQEYLRKKHDYNFYGALDDTLRHCCTAFSKVLGNSSKHGSTTRCQLFGLDFVLDNTLRPMLIEVNKGPEMSWSSQVEKTYKKQMATDMFDLLGYIEDKDRRNEFTMILEVNK